MVNTGIRISILASALVALATPVHGQDPPEPVTMDFECDGTHRTQVIVDGIQRDWEDEARPAERVGQLVEGAWRYDYTGPVDASFRVWCRYTENGLYFAVVGRDNVVVAPERGHDGDLFEVFLNVRGPEGEDASVGVRLPLWDLEGEGLAVPVWAPGTGREGEVRAARGEVSPRDNGYFLEFNIPYIADPALHQPYAPVRFFAAHRDWDYDARGERVAVVASAPYERDDPETWGTMSFTGPAAEIRRLARDRGVDPDRAVGRVFANVGGSPAAEHVFVLDGHLFVAGTDLGDYSWTSLLVGPNANYSPVSLQTRDLDDDGDAEILYRYRRTRRSIDAGGDIAQEFVAVYDAQLPEIVRLFTQEVAYELPDGTRFEMEMEFRDRSDRTLVRFARPTGSTIARDAWVRVEPGDDEQWNAALTPWSDRTRIDWDRHADGRWVVLAEHE